MPSKFKLGDKVRVDPDFPFHGEHGLWFPSDELELVKEEKENG